jgi:hypothetical protein
MKKTWRTIALIAAALMLPAPAQATAPPPPLTAAYLIGFWTDDGDCGHAIEFRADGRFVNADGGSGTWKLEGNRLTLVGTASLTVRLEAVDAGRVVVYNEDGSIGGSTRCPSRGAAADTA